MSSLIKLNRKISSPLKSKKKFSKDKKFSIRQTNFIFQFVSYFIEIYYKKCLDDSSIQGVDVFIRLFIEEIKNLERNIEKMYYYVSNVSHLKHMLIENFNKKTIKLLLEVINYKFISSGNLIYKKGENPSYFYGIIKGEVGIMNNVEDFYLIKKDKNYNNISLLCKNIFKSGDFFGEKEIFLNSTRNECAFSMTDIHLFYIDRKSFIKLLYKNIFSLYEYKLKFIKDILRINDEQKDSITNKYFDINVFLTIIESTLYMKDEKIIDQNEISQKIFFVYKNSCIVKRRYIDFKNNNSDFETKIYDNSKNFKNIKLLNLMPTSLFGGEFILDPNFLKFNNLNSFSVYASNNFTTILSFDKTCFDKILNININQKASIIFHLQSIIIKMMKDINNRYNFFLCLMNKKNSLLINKNEVIKKEKSKPLIINKKNFFLRNIKQENNLSKEKTLNKNKKLKIEFQKRNQPSLLRKDYIINGRNMKYLIDEFSLNTQVAKEENKSDKLSFKNKFYITSINNTKLKKYDNDQSHSNNSFITYDYPMNVKINSFQKIINLKKLIKSKNRYYNSGKLNIPLITNYFN